MVEEYASAPLSPPYSPGHSIVYPVGAIFELRQAAEVLEMVPVVSVECMDDSGSEGEASINVKDGTSRLSIASLVC